LKGKKEETHAEAMAAMKARWYERHPDQVPPEPKPKPKRARKVDAAAKAHAAIRAPQPVTVKHVDSDVVTQVDAGAFKKPVLKLKLTRAQRAELMDEGHPRIAFPRYTPDEPRRGRAEDGAVATQGGSCPLCGDKISSGEDRVEEIDPLGTVHLGCARCWHPCPVSVGEVCEATSLVLLVVTRIKEVKRSKRVKGKGDTDAVTATWEEWEIGYEVRDSRSKFLGRSVGYASSSGGGALRTKQAPIKWPEEKAEQFEPEREPEAVSRKELTAMNDQITTEAVEAEIEKMSVSLQMSKDTLEVLERGGATSETTWGLRRSIEKQERNINRERLKLPTAKAA
jgi:hypothetical protein